MQVKTEEIFINEQIKNKYGNSPYRIPLRNREGVIVEFSLVDKKQFERVNKYKWHLVKVGYAQSSNVEKNTHWKMHHFLFRKPRKGYVIDHINEDKLDNRLCNLREATHSENNQNMSKWKKNATSTYKGVCYNGKRKEYVAQCNGLRLYHGDNEEEAATIYDIYTFQQYGRNANNNKMISYEDAMDHHYDFQKEKVERGLPQNISFSKYNGRKCFRVKKNFANKCHTYFFCTLEEAIKKLEHLNFFSKLSSIIEEKIHCLKPIERNRDGVAVIIAYAGEEILVSDEDWHMLMKYKWYIGESISSKYPLNNYNKRMHVVLIANDDQDKVIHHKNSNTLDNRRENLAIVSRSVNAHQRKKRKNASSKYFGVCFQKNMNKWTAEVRKERQRYRLGFFSSEHDAARAYNEKVKELFAEFANLNVIEE